jgi:hypothetical protein
LLWKLLHVMQGFTSAPCRHTPQSEPVDAFVAEERVKFFGSGSIGGVALYVRRRAYLHVVQVGHVGHELLGPALCLRRLAYLEAVPLCCGRRSSLGVYKHLSSA